MSVFADNPVLEREMKGRLHLRRKGASRSFSWVAAVLLLVIVYFYARGLVGLLLGPRQDAREFWGLLAYGLLTLIVLLAPALTATAITQEREQQTWDTLAATRLTGSEILLGKWLARQTIPLLLLALTSPYLLGCVVRGQIGWPTLLATVGFLIVTSLFYGALGLLCSYQAKRTATATAAALTCTAFLCIGTYIINSVIEILNAHYIYNSVVLWMSPFYALNALSVWLNGNSTSLSYQGYQYQYMPYDVVTFFYFIVTLLLTAAALLFMVRRYRQAVRG